MNQPTLVLATSNAGKAREFRGLLADLPWHFPDLDDYPELPPSPENGSTFAENAREKAGFAAARLGQWVLADDTGLEVDALNGEPGIRSARFAGPSATMRENRELLLARLGEIPLASRDARFVCCLALADPSGRIAAESSGECRGRMGVRAAGTGGFGYDSLFEIVEYHRTLAELDEAVAACLTHRARAVRSIRSELVHQLTCVPR